MDRAVGWALKKAWVPLRDVLEEIPVMIAPLAFSIHRDCYDLLRMSLQSGPTPGPAWDPWDVSAAGESPISWVIYAFLPSLIF